MSPDDPDADAVARAAGLDDFLGGFSAQVPSPPREEDAIDTAEADVGDIVDTILLLRQAAAADGFVPSMAPPVGPVRIGRHELLRLAGEGGFARVWEGFDTLLRRRVAVKVRRPELLFSASAGRRFVREAEIAARLVHPHIVTIFEVGTDAGQDFIAAEFCAGGSLAAWLDGHPGPMPARDAARLVRALAGAVAYAHRAGVVHRDIKPANVLLVPAPLDAEPILAAPPVAGGIPGYTVKLCDFGLGKVDDADDPNPLTQLTRSGASIGTPAWMAPEQIDRSYGPVGTATDVHALGLLLDRLLTGRALRGGSTTAETYRQVLFEEAAPADRLARGVSRDLAAVCLKCLAKRPMDRYPSAGALADDLDRWLDGRSTVARPLSPVGRAWHWSRRRPVVTGLALAAVAASLVAAWAGTEWIREQRAAARHQDDLRRQSAVAELRRGFDALRAGNVAKALEQVEVTRAIDPRLATSLAARWLDRRTHGESEILLTSAAGPPTRPRDLYALALTSDGNRAAVGGADGLVRLLHHLGESPTTTVVAAHDEVNDVAFSPDGTLLATVGQDGRLRWWHVGGEGMVAAGEADPGAGPLYAAAFAGDGRTLAIGGEDRVVRLVSLDAADRPIELFRFEQPPGKNPEVESLVFVDDTMVAASCGDMVVVIDSRTGRTIRELVPPDSVNRNAVLGSLTVSRDKTRLMACGTDARAHVWDVATGRLLTSLPAHPAWVQGCCFLGDGSRLATACRDGGIRVFDAATGATLARLVGHSGRVWSLVAEPAGTILSSGADGTVRRWDLRDFDSPPALRAIPVGQHRVKRITEGPRRDWGRTVIVCDDSGALWEIAIADGRRRGLLGRRDGRAIEIAVDGRRRRLALSWAEHQPVGLIDLDAASGPTPLAAPIPEPADPRQALACWTSAGELLVCARHGGLSLIPADLSRAVPVAAPLEDPVNSLTFAPAGAARVAASGKRSVVCTLPDPSAPAAVAAPVECAVGEETSAVGWSPDARLLVFGTRSGRVLLYDPVTGAAHGGLVPHERQVVGVVFSRDGHILVSADHESVRISDAVTRTTLDELRPGWKINALCLTADEGCLIIGGEPSDAARDEPRLAVLELDRR